MTTTAAATVVDAWPLTPLQRGLLFHSLWERDADRRPSYLLQYAVEVHQDPGEPAWREALDLVFDRHENLRAGFYAEGQDGPVQFIVDKVRPQVTSRELDDVDVACDSQAFQSCADEEWALGIDPARPPLLRVQRLVGHAGHAVVLFTTHHLIIDGWSVPLFLEQVLRAAAGSGVAADADAPTYLDYLDEIVPENAPTFEDACNQRVVATLEGLDAPTLFTGANEGVPRSAERSAARHGRIELCIGAELAAQARQQGVSLASIVSAAWALSLGRLVDTDDVVFGVTLSGRTSRNEAVVGLLGNTLPLRVPVGATSSLREVMKAAHGGQGVLADAQGADLAGVQKTVGLGALFDSLLVVENYPGDVARWSAGPDALSVVDTWARDDVHYPILVQVQLGDVVTCDVRVRDDAGVEIEVVLDALRTVLIDLVEHPEAKVSELRFGGENEDVTSILEGGPAMPIELDDALRKALDEHGEDLALFVDGEQFTTQQLHARAESIARALEAVPFTGVGILSPRAETLVSGVLAALLAHRPFVGMDPAVPRLRLADMLKDAEVGALVVAPGQEELARALGFLPVPCPGHEETSGQVWRSAHEPEASDDHVHDAGGDAAAYIVFTSGTSGRPKGCINTRRGLEARLGWMVQRYALGADEVFLHKTPLSFDVSVWELVLPLVLGARLVLAPPGAHADPEALDALMAEHDVTTVHFVPSMLAAFLDLVPEPRARGVRFLFASGERLTTLLAQRASEAFGADVHNLYGPAEAAIDVTAANQVQRAAGRDASIGTAVPGTSLLVLDSAMRPVGLGGQGELYLGGTQVARGYAGRPALTALRFVADPRGGGHRLYRTGDLVRVEADGLRYLGRSDAQVKIRGMRVEPAATSTVLESLPGIGSAAVVVDAEAGPGLVGAVTAVDEVLDLEAVRAELASLLPVAQQVVGLVTVRTLPVTPNGKIDEHEVLRLVRAARAQPSTPKVRTLGCTPSTADPTAERLASIGREVLGREIGIHDDLIVEGLDSLSAIRFVALARKARIGLDLDAVFAWRTPSAMADHAEKAARSARDASADHEVQLLPELNDAARAVLDALAPHREAVLPLGPLQEGLFVHAQLTGSDLDVYVVQHELTLRSALDVEALQRAGDALLRRHPSLRAGFTARNMPQPVAFITPATSLPLEVLDLTQVPEADQAGRLEEIQAGQVEAGFDLEAPPLIRLVAVELGHEHWRLVLAHHHILTDGWSQTLMLQDLFDLYDIALQSPGPVSDASLEPSADYAEYLRWVARQDQSAALEVWKKEMADLPGPTLVRPRSVDTPPVLAESVSARVPQDLSDALRSLARESSVTLSTVLSYAWAHVLRGLTGSDDVVFGTTVSGRPADLAGVERMVGLLMNTIPVRVAVRPADDVRAALREHMAAQGRTMAAHHVGLAHVQRAARTSVLFDTLYVLRNLPSDDEERSATFAKHRIVEADAYDGTHYSLAMTINPGENLEVALAYRPDMVEAEAAQRYLQRYLRVLRALADGRGAVSVASLDTAAPGEREIIERVNQQATRVAPEDRHDVDAGVSVAHLLAAAASMHPERTALVGRDLSGADVRWSFARLQAVVDEIAAGVMARTSGPEALVALALPRTVEHVAAIFAVMRAGRAYVPLDLAHPSSRRSDIAIRAGAELVVHAEGDDEAVVEGLPSWGLGRLGESPSLYEPADIHPDQLAYTIFTSGSTGEPKGVAVPHRGLVTMYDNHRQAIFTPALELADHSPVRVAHTVSFAFDMSWEELFWLLDGHEVHVIDEERRLEVSSLVQHYADIGIDVLNVTPSYGRELMRAGLFEARQPALMLLGGEAVPSEMWRGLREREGLMAYDLYGPTEFTINALGADLKDYDLPSLGRPILDARAYVLDSSLHEVPPGGVGELYLAGAGLTRGYLGRPELTATNFVADPFSAIGGRLYRTGDLVQRRDDGTLEYRGRGDGQVKVRGHRLELAEVEASAEVIEEVAQAAATVLTNDAGSAVLCLYVVPLLAPDQELDEEKWLSQIRSRLAAVLPGYAVPGAVMRVDAIPLTTNGKTDRSALPRPRMTISHEPPRGRLERIVAEIFTEVLGVRDVSRESSFFDLGGHSLVAMRVVTRLQEELGAQVPIGVVMANPTVATLARAAVDPERHSGLAPVLRLREGHDATVFCVHPAGGFAWQFSPLASLLPDGVGVVGLQAPALTGADDGAETVRDVARSYLRHVREEQPHGPYRLVGYSFGGNVVHEMAALLIEQGEAVESLVLLDPGPLDGAERPKDEEDLQAVREEQGAFLAEVAGETDLDAETREALRVSRGVLGRGDAETLDAIVRSHAWASRVMAASRSPHTRVPTLLVTAADENSDPGAWDDLLGDDVDVLALQTDHSGVVSPASWAQIAPAMRRMWS